MSRDGMTWSVVPTPDGSLFEGPSWIQEAAAFQWVDILEGTLYRWRPGSPSSVEVRNTGLEFATVALPLDGDAMIIASRSSLHRYSWGSGEIEDLGSWTFPADIRFNDGSISPGGDVYIGTMSMTRDVSSGSLYRYDQRSRALHAVLSGVGISNGMAWDSPFSAYYIDSLQPRIDRLQLMGANAARAPWLDLEPEDEPDGLAVAADGTVVVALWGGSCLGVVAPSGEQLTRVPVPARFPTSVSFGGSSGELILVTAARDDGRSPGCVLVGSTSELLEGKGVR